jgi:hypothetical protein
MSARLYLPCDAGALAVGADEVATALVAAARERNLALDLVRTGSRGLYWLEPMLEVATPEGRIAYGPVGPGDVATLLDAGLLEGGAHALRLGRPEDLPFLARQTRLTFARCGVVDPLSIEDYRAHGGWQASSARSSWRRRKSSRRSSAPACAVAAAPASRPGSSGAPSCRPKACRNTWSATRMRAIPAPSPIA